MKTYSERIFEELVQDNSSEAKLRRYLERKRREAEERERNRPRPKTREELQDLIIKEIEGKGPNVNLNHIDTSEIEDMNFLFCIHYNNDINKSQILQSFNGDISDWDVRKVTNMNNMFCGAASFNQDISNWKEKLGSVTDMSFMFDGAESFDQNLSSWDVARKYTVNMFKDCPIDDKNKPKGLE